jgi:Flp pilus assembly protein TadG
MIRDDRGVAALEFGLIAPVLLLMIGGIIEYGRVLAAQQATRDIIDAAARRGVVEVLSNTAVQEQIEADLAAVPALDTFAVEVLDGADLEVNVTASFDLVLGAFLPEDALTFQMTTRLRR